MHPEHILVKLHPVDLAYPLRPPDRNSSTLSCPSDYHRLKSHKMSDDEERVTKPFKFVTGGWRFGPCIMSS